MDKTKKIIISLSIAIVVVIILNYIVITHTNSDYIQIPVFKEAILKGKQVTNQEITMIQVKKTKYSEQLMKTINAESIQGKVLKEDVQKGELITENNFLDEEEALEKDINYKYISIPVSNLSYATCSKLKKGDIVTIYFTAKTKDVSNAIKDKERLYSNSASEGLVTCLLCETVEVISVHDSTGKETNENLVTDILVRLNKEQAILVANLKSQGAFDIVLI